MDSTQFIVTARRYEQMCKEHPEREERIAKHIWDELQRVAPKRSVSIRPYLQRYGPWTTNARYIKLVTAIDDMLDLYSQNQAWKINGLTQQEFLRQALQFVRNWIAARAVDDASATVADACCEHLVATWQKYHYLREPQPTSA
jgi:hypothetical protein